MVTGGRAGLLEMLCAVRCSTKCALFLGVFLRDVFSRSVRLVEAQLLVEIWCKFAYYAVFKISCVYYIWHTYVLFSGPVARVVFVVLVGDSAKCSRSVRSNQLE